MILFLILIASLLMTLFMIFIQYFHQFMTLIINLIVSFIMNFFISSFINNDITYNINGFTTRYIVIDRLMHNDFGCYLLFLKTPFIFFSELILVKKTCMVQKVGHWGSLSCCYILPGPLILLHQSLLIRQIGVGTEKAFYRAATYPGPTVLLKTELRSFQTAFEPSTHAVSGQSWRNMAS